MPKNCAKTLLLCCAFFWSFAAFAEINSDVIIQGNERVDDETIIRLIDVEAVKKSLPKAIPNSLKKLYESDLFLESKIDLINDKVVVEVKENPLISDVKFSGNKKIEDEALQSEIISKKRTVFTKSKLQSDLKRINEIYLKSGRFLTKIDPKIIQKDQNRVELIFEIFEGPKAKIGKIYFIGNAKYSDRELIDEISTKESKWWKFLSSSDSYDSDRIEFDREKLRRFYGSNGYADFTVISSVAQISPQKDEFFITYLLEEGIQYRVGEVNIINRVEKFDASILDKEIILKKGKIYNSEQVEKTVDRMVEVMSEKSYAFAHVEPVLKRDRDSQLMNIDFVIEETPRVYIEQILISGNTRTMDEVIRRELRIREGDAYNLTKINRSKQRLENLGFFEKVDFKTKRIGDSDKVNLEIEVKEKKTGELTLGVGYSTVDRLSANAGIKERNLFGTGQELGINFQRSFARMTSEVNYTKPRFLDLPIDAGVDVFKYELDKRNSLIYDQTSQGFTLRGDYLITEYLSHQMRYSYSEQAVGNIDKNASFGVQLLEGNFTSSGIGQTFSYDRRDNRINPRDGYYISASQDYAGLGGNINTIKHEGSAGYYVPTISKDFVFKLVARGGTIQGVGGEPVRSNYGFFLGGNNFRGFQFAGIGPRTIDQGGNAKGGSILGGKTYYVGTAEFMFPLGLPRELGINGILFSDNGTVKGVDEQTLGGAKIADSGSIRSSYGFSLAWASPMGPIRLDFAKVAKREEYDRTQTFRFSFGTNF